ERTRSVRTGRTSARGRRQPPPRAQNIPSPATLRARGLRPRALPRSGTLYRRKVQSTFRREFDGHLALCSENLQHEDGVCYAHALEKVCARLEILDQVLDGDGVLGAVEPGDHPQRVRNITREVVAADERLREHARFRVAVQDEERERC